MILRIMFYSNKINNFILNLEFNGQLCFKESKVSIKFEREFRFDQNFRNGSLK